MFTSSQGTHQGYALWKTILWVILAIIVVFLVVSVVRAKNNSKNDVVGNDMILVKNAAVIYKTLNDGKYIAEDSVFSIDSIAPNDLAQINADLTKVGSSLNIVVKEDGTAYAAWAKVNSKPAKFVCVDDRNMIREIVGAKYPTKENPVCQ